MKHRFSIGTRLTLLVSGLMVLIVCVIAAAIFFFYRSALDEQLRVSANATIDLVHQEIRAWLLPKHRTIVALNLEAQVLFPEVKTLQRFYAQHTKSDPDFSETYIFENKSYKAGGIVMTSSGWTPPKDYDQFARSWFTSALATEGIILTAPYVDTITNKLVVTVAQRVPGKDKPIGVVGADMFITRVGEIVAATKKISASGKTYLLDQDGQYLTNESQEKILKASPFEEASFAPLKAGILAQDLSFQILRARGLYVASKRIPEMSAVLLTWGPLSEIYGDLYRFLGLLVLIALVGLALSVVFVILISRSITRPLAAVIRKVEELAQGDLSLETDSTYLERGDEIGDLARSMDSLVSSFREVITSVQTAAGRVASSSKEMSQSAESLSQGATEQASSMEEVSSSMEEMASNIRQNTDNAHQTDQIAQKVSRDAEQGGTKVSEAVVAVREIASRILIIEEIARQTNLLALNAAIEAARAGEAGKGFAVVASEVRKLAERSQTAAGEINAISQRTVGSAEDANRIIDALLPEIKKTAQLVQEITAASREQNQGADQINQALLQLDTVVQQSASMSEELSATAEELEGQAQTLKDAVAYFKLGGEAAPKAAAASKAPRAPMPQLVAAEVPARPSPAKPAPQARSTKIKPLSEDPDFEEF